MNSLFLSTKSYKNFKFWNNLNWLAEKELVRKKFLFFFKIFKI
jgi:hypothetical protein